MRSLALILLTLLVGVLTSACNPVPDQSTQETEENSLSSLVAPEAQIQKLAGGFQFTEGPAANAVGDVYFTDIPNNRIHKWSVDGELSTFREDSGAANGLYFDPKGNLLACEGGNRQLVSIDPAENVTVLADSFNSKKLNSPNDLWRDPKGGIYFTDPRYGNRDNLEQDGEHVYYLPPGGGFLIRVIDDLVRPNGIIGTPNGERLFVADHGDEKTYSYLIDSDGTLSNKQLFASQGSDGVTLDEFGNLYLTREGVSVYDPQGNKLGMIEVPERPANVCFGGREHRTLFITARSALYSLEMQVAGMRAASR
jgi:gluconolactonase